MIKQRNRFLDVLLFFTVVGLATAAYTVNTDKANAVSKQEFTFNPKQSIELLIDSKTGWYHLETNNTNTDITAKVIYENVPQEPKTVFVHQVDTVHTVRVMPALKLAAPRFTYVKPNVNELESLR